MIFVWEKGSQTLPIPIGTTLNTKAMQVNGVSPAYVLVSIEEVFTYRQAHGLVKVTSYLDDYVIYCLSVATKDNIILYSTCNIKWKNK